MIIKQVYISLPKCYRKVIRIALSFVLLYTFSAQAYSQNWSEKYSIYQEYYNQQSFDTALIYIEQTIELAKQDKILNDSLYSELLSELGNTQLKLKQYANAINSYISANKSLNKTIEYAYNCEQISFAYWELKDYKEVSNYIEAAQEVRTKIQGKNTIEYANNCLILARAYVYLRKVSEADIMFNECKQIREQVFGKQSNEYIEVCSELANLNRRRRKYKEAELLFIESKNLRNKVMSDTSRLYASDCENLAMLYNKMGNYTAAEQLLLETIKIRQSAYGKNNDNYIEAVSNLALVYKNSGQYVQAEPFYIEAKNLIAHLHTTKSAAYADACNNLALLYSYMGNYAFAEPLFVEAKDIRAEILGKESIDYAVSCNNIAALYINLKYYNDAKPLLIESKDLKAKIDGKKSTSYANSCNNLAYLYAKTGEFSSAEKLYKQARKINGKKYGKWHINYIKACNNLGTLYLDNNNLKKAESLLIESRNIAQEKLGISHPYYAEICNNLARLYLQSNNISKAEPLYYESINTIKTIMKNSFGLLTEKEKELFFATFSKNFNDFYAFALTKNDSDSQIAELVYNTALNNKSMLLKSSTAMRYAILNSNDSVLLAKYDEWISLKKQISDYYSLPIYERGDELKNIEIAANDLERTLIEESILFAKSENEKNITWLDVKNSLNKNEAAVEFIHFKTHNDSTFYCALIIKPDSKYPEMIKLFEERQLQDIFGKFLMNNLRYINTLYGTKDQNNTKLYNLIWEPVANCLSGYNHVYISPSGLLYKISFSALCKEQNVFLCDLYQIDYKTSTSKLVNSNQSYIDAFSAFVIGGVQYNSDTTESNIWTYLPGTKIETDSITTILQSEDALYNYYYDRNASENYFKLEATDYNILHISTHGFFYPNPEENRPPKHLDEKEKEENRASANGDWGFGQYAFALNKLSMMRSGLVLARANDVWNKGSFPQPMIEDGVLTALEVSQLNLLNVKLAVMSACETGLGDIKGSEGVYGLQRSFKLAGVDYLIMSLWKVADKETQEFMTCFYKNLLISNDVKIAFNTTQKEMRSKYDPYFWAAFVLME